MDLLALLQACFLRIERDQDGNIIPRSKHESTHKEGQLTYLYIREGQLAQNAGNKLHGVGRKLLLLSTDGTNN